MVELFFSVVKEAFFVVMKGNGWLMLLKKNKKKISAFPTILTTLRTTDLKTTHTQTSTLIRTKIIHPSFISSFSSNHAISELYF